MHSYMLNKKWDDGFIYAYKFLMNSLVDQDYDACSAGLELNLSNAFLNSLD